MKMLLTFIAFISIGLVIYGQQNSSDLTYLKDKKSKGIVEIGYGIKNTSYGYDFLKLNAIYGRKINPFLSIGIGTGLRLYLDNNALFNSFAAYPEIPFFADLRMNFNNKKVAPYLALDFGYTFQADDNFKGLGLLINPAIGVRFKSSAKTSTNLGIGYDIQQVEDYGLDGPSKKVYFGAISLNAGITF